MTYPLIHPFDIDLTKGFLARFQLREDLNLGGFIVPADHPIASDGESVPWFVRWLFPRASRALFAAIAHDYRLAIATTEAERFAAHRLFRDDLMVYRVPKWRVELMWRAVMLADHRLPVRLKLRTALFD